MFLRKKAYSCREWIVDNVLGSKHMGSRCLKIRLNRAILYGRRDMLVYMLVVALCWMLLRRVRQLVTIPCHGLRLSITTLADVEDPVIV